MKQTNWLFALNTGWKCVLCSCNLRMLQPPNRKNAKHTHIHVHSSYILYMFRVSRWSGWMVKIVKKDLQYYQKYKRLKTSSRSATNSALHESTQPKNIYYKTLFIPSSSYYSCDFFVCAIDNFIFLFVASKRFPFWRFHYMFAYILFLFFVAFRSQWNNLLAFEAFFWSKNLKIWLFNFNHNIMIALYV